MTQKFGLWFIPFRRARVNLTTVLTLKQNRGDDKYYIDQQNDLYQTDEFVRFIIPPSWILVWAWQFWSTFFCVLGAAALWPISYAQQWVWEETESRKSRNHSGRRETHRDTDLLDGIGLQDLERKARVNSQIR